jgi:hypothetical protein
MGLRFGIRLSALDPDGNSSLSFTLLMKYFVSPDVQRNSLPHSDHLWLSEYRIRLGTIVEFLKIAPRKWVFVLAFCCFIIDSLCLFVSPATTERDWPSVVNQCWPSDPRMLNTVSRKLCHIRGQAIGAEKKGRIFLEFTLPRVPFFKTMAMSSSRTVMRHRGSLFRTFAEGSLSHDAAPFCGS